MDPMTALIWELARAGHHVPVATLQACLTRADIRLAQGQRPAVAAHLAEVERLSREAMGTGA